jgi:hypothetical protein
MDVMDMLDKSYQGFAQGNSDTLEALTKALSAGSGVNTANFTGLRAMTPESLDTTLVNVLWTQDEARLFKALKKNPVKSPVHQWAKRTDVGDGDGAWVAEGGDSLEKDQTIERVYVTMKYLQTLRKVTLQATLVNSIEDAEASEKIAGTLWLIKQIEKILFYGDSSCIAEEPDGLIKSIETANVIDLRGADASSVAFENTIAEGTRRVRGNYGVSTDLFGSLMMMEDVQKLLRDRIRFPNGKVADGSAVFERYITPFGRPKLVDDIFIQEGAVGVASTITASRPSQPSIAVVRAASGASVSKFVSGDAGDYYYQVAHANKYGLSQLSAAVQVASVVADDKVTITVTDGGTPGTAVHVFRSKKDAADGTDCRFMTKLAYTADLQEIVDLNEDLPGTSSAFLLNLNPAYDAMEWNQLLPMMKFPLFPTNAAVIPFLMLLFGALGVKKQEQQIRMKNISYSKMGWF